MAGFSELIKNYEKTRDYIRDFFIFGFKVRNEYNRKSSRTYDDEKRRIESWLGEYMTFERSVKGQHTAITADSGHISENPLYQTFCSRSFTDNDIKLHFMIADILYKSGYMTLRQIVDGINERFEEIFDEQTVRNKLREYSAEGIIICRKKGKTAYFGLSCDTVRSFLDEYKGLEDAVKFFSENDEFSVIGNSILKFADIKNDIFLMKHYFIVHTLEDILLYDIINAIREKRYITLNSFGTGGREQKIVPMQIFVSVRTGRRYITGFSREHENFGSYRLDFIKNITPGGVCSDYDGIKKIFDENSKFCYGVSFVKSREFQENIPMRIVFRIEENEDYILERLEREKRCGEIDRCGDNLYFLTLRIFDPNEAMHWVKSFFGRIVSVEGTSDEVKNRFYRDVQDMYALYGGYEDDGVQ
ncbi:MAG: WYL domain-containing protein [Ruminococcus sp.]|nr:WYL domain-containing protein [Ruminococcus sp.]